MNLIAKGFISFFFKTLKKKSKAKVAPSKRRRGRVVPPPDSDNFNGSESVLVEEEVDQATREMAEEVDDIGVMDDSKAAHDEATVRSVKGQALEAARQIGITMTAKEEDTALKLFPKVAGLARRVHDSGTLQEKFEKLVEAHRTTPGQKASLDRRVPTRWNSDFACLAAHIYFETPIKQLTSDTDNDLGAYILTEDQWTLARQLVDVLEIFQDITDLFSKAEVPLIHNVIPMLEALEHDLTAVSESDKLPAVIRIAAIAGLLIISKYYALTDDNEVYRIAIVMCPDKKLQWFALNEDWRSEDRIEVDRIVRHRWAETYSFRSTPGALSPDTARETRNSAAPAPKVRKWASTSRVQVTPTISQFPPDSIDAYLASPCVASSDIEEAGGVLLYWEKALKTRPRLARMALDFLSAPASSVDAERAFSGGRLQVNHLQHKTSSQTFKARVALGSWADSPLLPSSKPAEYIQNKLDKGARRARTGLASSSNKGKQKEVLVLVDSDISS